MVGAANTNQWPQKERRLSIDWRLPIGGIVFLMFQTMVLISVGASWKTNTEARLNGLEKNMSSITAYNQQNDENREKTNIVTARLEERFASMDQKLGDIRDQLIMIKKGP